MDLLNKAKDLANSSTGQAALGKLGLGSAQTVGSDGQQRDGQSPYVHCAGELSS